MRNATNLKTLCAEMAFVSVKIIVYTGMKDQLFAVSNLSIKIIFNIKN